MSGDRRAPPRPEHAGPRPAPPLIAPVWRAAGSWRSSCCQALSRTSSTSARCRRRWQHRRTATGFRSGPARWCPARSHETANGVHVRSHRRQGDDPVVPPRRPARPVQGRAPVVCEGRWSTVTFDSDRILIRHGSEYKPPQVATGPWDADREGGARSAALRRSGSGGRARDRRAVGSAARDDAAAALGRRYGVVVLAAARCSPSGDGVGAAHARLLAALRRREQRPGRRCCTRSPACGPRSRARSCSGA